MTLLDDQPSVGAPVPHRPLRRLAAPAAVAGVLAAATGLGVGELVAALIRPQASPIVVVANRFILATPEWLKRWAIQRFGTDDKVALGTGIFVVIGVFAAVVGMLALRSRRAASGALAVFGAVGVYCALTTRAHRSSDVVPVVFAAAAAALVLDALVTRLLALAPPGSRAAGSRRNFLVVAVGSAALAALSGFGGRRWQQSRFAATRSRAAVVLPPESTPAPVLPRAAVPARSPLPFVTANEDFYRIDTAYQVPQITAASWHLKITGMVDTPITISFAELLAMPLVERYITLACVSNEVGGNLIGTALFRGALLKPLLERAGLRAGADQLVCRSSDGMTIGAPVAQVMDGRDAMLAVGMNGVALPVAHGFPVRMVVPGLYGYVSACKWITSIEVSTFDAYDAYWVQRGWVAQLPIALSSRIDTPKSGRTVKVGSTVPIAGVAWHQHVGISTVQVQIDGGDWLDTKLGSAPSKDTWRQWVLPWTVPTAGMHRLTVRAFDTAGNPQATARHEPYPGASSGLHSISVNASN